MATTTQRATSATPGALLPFRRNTTTEPGAFRPTLLNPKPLMANSKPPKEIGVNANRVRRASTPNPGATEPRGKEREMQKAKSSVDSSSNSPDTDPDYNASTSSYESNVLHIPAQPSSVYSHSRPSTAGTSGAPSSHSPPSLLKRTRGSILGAASDALGKLGRRRSKTTPPMRPQPYIPIILPDVIEISAPRRDEEVEEREKLKEDAARAILGPAFLDNSNATRESDDIVEGEDDENVDQHNHEDMSACDEEVHSISNTEHSNLVNSSTMSVTRSRYRPGSLHTHSRNNSITPVSIPSFPSTPSALTQFMQDSSTLPKYYPSTSLRIFALSKSWKSRYMVLSSPVSFPLSFSSTRSSPSPSYLHLFKSSGSDEKELERLEINEESVVFVAEEEVAGRRHVVKVGGVDVGALKREYNVEEGGRTMWFLQITDTAEAQKWIAAIKNAILGQRTVRAGISPLAVQPLMGNEPRGDMDVMLTMRRQGIFASQTSANTDALRPSTATNENPSIRQMPSPLNSASPPPSALSAVGSPSSYSSIPATPPATASTFAFTDPESPRKAYDEFRKGRHSSKHSNPNYASSISSQSIRSQATTPKSGHISITPGNAVSALKGLFNRPRSPSRASHATSFDQEREGTKTDKPTHIVIGGANTEDRETIDGSFASMGNSLLNMLKSPDGTSRTLRLGSSSGPGTPQKHHTMLPYSGGSVLNSSTPPSTNSGYYGMGADQQQLERKIVVHPSRQSIGWQVEDSPVQNATSKDRPNKSLSLQPPPRKRWTTPGLSLIETKVEQSGLYHHVNGNSSVAGSFGLGFSQHDHAATLPLSDSSPTVSGHSLGTPEQRPRAPSIQSVSTFASTGDVGLSVERSSTSTKRSSSMKRWSRQGSSMLTPPSMPHAPSHGSASSSSSFTPPIGRVHPYAAGASVDRPPSRTSTRSVASDRSVVSGLPTFSKRASTSSAVSVNTSPVSSQPQSFTNGFTSTISRVTNTHRASMPPPRPAPTSALPPAPDQDLQPKATTPPATKTSFRESMAHRALRLSLIAPKPPPPTALPPRPDERQPPAIARSHRRTSSVGSEGPSSELYSIPSSPLSPPVAPPFPPPSGPLPPTPGGSTSPPTRHSSIKQRLRILSAPSQSQPVGSNGSTPNLAASIVAIPQPLQVSSSQPGTPIAEKITHLQNDPSFLQMHSPIIPSLPAPIVRSVSPPPEQLTEVTSLSPPPRRSSKQMSLFDKEIDGAIASADAEQGPTIDVEPKPLPLSRHGSVISLGIVSM